MKSPGNPIRVALADDHAMVREALSSVLDDHPRIEVVAQAEDTAGAARLARGGGVDVLVLDYNMPGGGALPILGEAGRSESDTRILVLTIHESIHYAVRVIESGADGFVVKSSAVEELVDAIEAVHGGNVYVAPRFRRAVFDQLRRPKTGRVGLESLSAREFELLRMLGSGQGLSEAALQLKISVSTASTYRARLLKKLNLDATSELIRFAIENGICG